MKNSRTFEITAEGGSGRTAETRMAREDKAKIIDDFAVVAAAAVSGGVVPLKCDGCA